MAFVRWLLWTSFSIGFGIFLARYEVNGDTPLSHLERAFGGAPKMEKLEKKVSSAIHEAKTSLRPPSEQHSADEREKLNRLIAGRRSK